MSEIEQAITGKYPARMIGEGLQKGQFEFAQGNLLAILVPQLPGTEIKDAAAAVELTSAGVVLQDWSTEDRITFRTMAREAYARGHEGNGKITNHPDLA